MAILSNSGSVQYPPEVCYSDFSMGDLTAVYYIVISDFVVTP